MDSLKILRHSLLAIRGQHTHKVAVVGTYFLKRKREPTTTSLPPPLSSTKSPFLVKYKLRRIQGAGRGVVTWSCGAHATMAGQSSTTISLLEFRLYICRQPKHERRDLSLQPQTRISIGRKTKNNSGVLVDGIVAVFADRQTSPDLVEGWARLGLKRRPNVYPSSRHGREAKVFRASRKKTRRAVWRGFWGQGAP